MKKFNTASKILATASALIMSASAAQAQSMDYSSLEMLFGEPVTTSANGTPQRISEVPLNMEIITAEDIARKPANNIADVLRGVSGVSVWNTARGMYDVGFRGMNQGLAEKVLVLVNGRQVYIDSYGFVNWDLIPVQLSEIQQIEIVKGPNTALFGFNAVSGVINILTKDPLHNELGEVSASYGNQDFIAGSYAQIFKPMDNVGIRVSAGGYQAENYEVDQTAGESLVREQNPKSRSFSADAKWKVSDKTELGFEITHAENKQTSWTAGNMAGADMQMDSFKATLLSDTDYGLVELKAYHNMTDIYYKFPSGFASGVPFAAFSFDDENRVTVVSLSDTFKVGTDHKVRLSTEYRHNSNLVTGDQGNDTQYDIYSGAGLWDWAISDKWNLSTGVRLDHLSLDKDEKNLIVGGIGSGAGSNPFTNFDQNLTEYAYNVGLVYKMSDYDTFRVMAARGIDIPSLIEFGFQNCSGITGLDALCVFGNPNTEASAVTNYEFGYDRKIDQINGLGRFAAYYQNFDEAQSLTANSGVVVDDFVLSGDNVGDVWVWGIEASLEGQSDAGLDWGLTYNLQLPNNDYGRKSGTDFAGSNPKNTINVNAGYAFNDKLRLDGLAQYVSKYRMNDGSDNNKQFGDNVLVNAKLSYQAADNVTLSLNTIGLLDDVRGETGGAEVERNVWAQVNVKF